MQTSQSYKLALLQARRAMFNHVSLMKPLKAYNTTHLPFKLTLIKYIWLFFIVSLLMFLEKLLIVKSTDSKGLTRTEQPIESIKYVSFP